MNPYPTKNHPAGLQVTNPREVNVINPPAIACCPGLTHIVFSLQQHPNFHWYEYHLGKIVWFIVRKHGNQFHKLENHHMDMIIQLEYSII